MKIDSLAISVTVENVQASSKFLLDHFAFKEKWSTSEFAYLIHDDITSPVIFMQSGMNALPETIREQKISGCIIAFVVKDLELEERRLKKEGVSISSPISEDPWGERLFQITDPNGLTIQLVQWVQPSDSQYK
jgi:predicted enzyme related to lactoylglutathione lyase